MTLNRYTVRFSRRCPVNGHRIFYTLVVRTTAVVMVEEIDRVLGLLTDPVLHEDAADILAGYLPGENTLTAVHGYVEIETVRGSL